MGKIYSFGKRGKRDQQVRKMVCVEMRASVSCSGTELHLILVDVFLAVIVKKEGLRIGRLSVDIQVDFQNLILDKLLSDDLFGYHVPHIKLPVFRVGQNALMFPGLIDKVAFDVGHLIGVALVGLAHLGLLPVP